MPNELILPNEMPLVVVSPHLMLLPKTLAHINLERQPDILQRIQDSKTPYVFLTMKADAGLNEPKPLYSTGVVASVTTIENKPLVMVVRGEWRAKFLKKIDPGPDSTYYLVSISEPYTDKAEKFFEESGDFFVIAQEFKNRIRAQLSRTEELIGALIVVWGETDDQVSEGSMLESIYNSLDSLDKNRRDVIDELIWNIVFSVPYLEGSRVKQDFIESQSLMQRLVKCNNLLRENINFWETRNRIISATPRRRGQRLIGSGDNTPPDNTQNKSSDDDWFTSKDQNLRNKYKLFCEIRDSVKDPREKEAFVEAAKRDIIELQTFEKSKGDGTQTAMTVASLDFVLALPWGKKSDEIIDFNEFERVFEGDHYGLGKVKEKVTDFIAVKKANPDGKSKVLLFAGPPGVGKTSVCMSIAEGLKRKYIRVSLGGIRDEAEIRGHRRTYIKAMAGRILTELKKAGTKNPVFVFDEVDKIGKDGFHGDPADALLEVLDPEQNFSFKDNYLEVPFDLSQVLFICTANNLSGIPPALLDRMEPVHFSGYTEEAKIQIAKKFLVPKSLADVGLAKDEFELKWGNNDPDDIILKLIRGYTREAGVRNIERMISNILYRMIKKEQRNPGYFIDAVIDEKLIEEVHGIPRYARERANETKVGEVIGLAWTETGGEILYIQSAIMPKQGPTVLSQTGQLGGVMKEADKLALSLQRIRLAKLNQTEKIENKLIHLHIPQGAVPKDGPSAGITACFSLESAIENKPVRQKLAMTGEITLSGMVTAVGGIKEKVIAAANAGIEVLILPKSNEKDYLEEVPESAKHKFHEVYFVESIEEARRIVFPEDNPTNGPEGPVVGC